MVDKDLDPAGISCNRPSYMDDNEMYCYIQEYMLYELKAFLHMNDIKEFKIAMIEYLNDGRELYREAAEDLLETQFECYEDDIRRLLLLV